MKQSSTNNVHLHGYVNDVKSFPMGKQQRFILDVATMEAWPKDKKDPSKGYDRKFTFHKVDLLADGEMAEKLNAVKADLAENEKNKDNKDYKPKNHEIAVDGALVIRENTADGIDYDNYIVAASAIKLDEPKQEKEARNSISLKGNISSIDISDDKTVAKIGIATHFFAPVKDGGTAVNFKGEEKPYEEKTSFLNTTLFANANKDLFEKIQKGEIAKGAFVSANGRIHNNNYRDKDGVYRSAMDINLNGMTVLTKKEEKKADVKEAPKEEKKAQKATARKRTTKKTI